MIPRFLEPALRQACGDASLRVIRLESRSGGCIHQAARVHTSAGDFFAKWNTDCDREIFLAEAAGLRALRGAGSALVIPEVIAAASAAGHAPPHLILEYLEPAGCDDEVALARGLAAIHRCQAAQFGFERATFCGSTRLDNQRTQVWPEFYAQHRLLPLVRAIDTARGFDAVERRLLERLVARLSTLLPHGPVPALIHGDLWSGNVMITARGPALFDPACAFADRELEFGITTLFGGFSARFFAAYQEAWPLPAGWRERNPLYQLYHLLNHCLIFGGSYGPQALAVAGRYV